MRIDPVVEFHLEQAQRLSSLVVPEHYVLTVAPDLAAERFSGTVVIRVRFQQAVSRVVLHAVDLDIEGAVVRSEGVTHRVMVSSQRDAETITFNFAAPVPPPVAEVMVSHSGRLRGDLRGFYVSRANGRKYAVTQLEATDARRLFPAFDEPRYKAAVSSPNSRSTRPP